MQKNVSSSRSSTFGTSYSPKNAQYPSGWAAAMYSGWKAPRNSACSRVIDFVKVAEYFDRVGSNFLGPRSICLTKDFAPSVPMSNRPVTCSTRFKNSSPCMLSSSRFRLIFFNRWFRFMPRARALIVAGDERSGSQAPVIYLASATMEKSELCQWVSWVYRDRLERIEAVQQHPPRSRTSKRGVLHEVLVTLAGRAECKKFSQRPHTTGSLACSKDAS